MDSEQKRERNQNGDIPSDIPGKKLIYPPKKTGVARREHKSNFNITGKDYKLGDRNTVR